MSEALDLLQEDSLARARALDPRGSFLVQAPAGSGKTGLLIQRYLALLAVVDEPERIVALTFTRKAAGEMRERILRALAEARSNSPVEAHQDHARRTRELALAVLERDGQRGWSLTEHPARLSVHTFDALAASIARRAPVAVALGPAPSYLEDASEACRAAAAAAIADADPDDVHWRTLLRHLDNDAARAADLIAAMLRRRDQWQRVAGGIDASPEALQGLRAALEDALRGDIDAVLMAARAAFPPGVATSIASALRFAADALAAHQHDAARALAAALTECAGSGGLPPARHDALAHWATLARFLLVRGGAQFRKSVNAKDGFPPPGSGHGAASRAAAKKAMNALCNTLSAVPGLAAALHAAGKLPPASIGDDAWNVIAALLRVLRVAHAHLLVEFAKCGQVDFVEGTLRALDALGEADTPSDLLLRLDARIDHLLVDEFQDTSIAQLDLLRRLTAGWSGDPARTLFAVGDPMQSIYRFREAEVRFFVRAQAEGSIAGLPVETLRLRRNFRSQSLIVDWSNRVFRQVLGQVSDPSRGVVPFAPAVANEAPLATGPTIDCCSSDDEEAATVVARLRAALTELPDARVAILVRARAHLARILPAMRDANIPYAAVDLDTLAERQAMLDLASLTYALVQPNDRTAWLAVLRAPWCGLSLRDLFVLGEAAGSEASLLDACRDRAVLEALSADGRARLRQAMAALDPAIESRGRASLASRVRGAWLALDGPSSLIDALDLDAAERFFEELAVHERAGDLADRASFDRALSALHAVPDDAANARVGVMTMHRAKGLEFDVVIVPGLACGAAGGEPPLVRWRLRDRGLIVAPLQPRGGEADPVYRHLADLDRDEEDAEVGRLLYVACTRARKRLHLIAAPGTRVDAKTGEIQWKAPIRGSSLAKLWMAIESDVADPPTVAAAIAPSRRPDAPPLVRFPLAHRATPPQHGLFVEPIASEAVSEAVPFDWVAEIARAAGVAAHRLLMRIARYGPDAWSDARIDALAPALERDFASQGFTADEARRARARVQDAVRRTLADARGRWLFDSRHADAHSEWALSGIEDDAVVHVVLDRTFVCDGIRWIVDFKTGVHEGGNPQAFLDSEKERYRAQLSRYARLVRGLEPSRPIRLALYHPLVDNGFREWAFED